MKLVVVGEHVELTIALTVFFIEFGLFVGQVNVFAIDQGVIDVGGDLEGVACGYDERGGFAWFDGAERFVDVEDLRCPECD